MLPALTYARRDVLEGRLSAGDEEERSEADQGNARADRARAGAERQRHRDEGARTSRRDRDAAARAGLSDQRRRADDAALQMLKTLLADTSIELDIAIGRISWSPRRRRESRRGPLRRRLSGRRAADLGLAVAIRDQAAPANVARLCRSSWAGGAGRWHHRRRRDPGLARPARRMSGRTLVETRDQLQELSARSGPLAPRRPVTRCQRRSRAPGSRSLPTVAIGRPHPGG